MNRNEILLDPRGQAELYRRVEELAPRPLQELEVPALEELWRRAKEAEHC